MADELTIPGTPRLDSSTPDLFSPINQGRISDVIIDQMRQLIRGGTLAEGARLPSERELCEQFGVSRVTVREALRVLEAGGLVEIRVGARGGTFVAAPDSRNAGTSITDLLAVSGLTAREVTEARQLIDLGAVPLACERATDDDLRELTELCDLADTAEASGTYSMELSAEFHVRLARTTHNQAITLLVQTLREPILMSLQRAHELAPAMGRRGIDEHRALVEAIRARDVEGAREIMTQHLSRTLARVTDEPTE